MTNFERIKSMEVAELADFLMSIYTNNTDEFGDFDFATYIDDYRFFYAEDCIDWLESESETE